MEFDNLNQFGIVFEMSPDLIKYQRTVYSFLEWLSEVGGLLSALLSVLTVVLKIFMYKAIDFYMVQQLYDRREVSDDQKISIKEGEEKEKLKLEKVSILKSNLVRFSPCKLKCSKMLNKEERLFINGLKHYEKKIDLENFFREFLDI